MSGLQRIELDKNLRKLGSEPRRIYDFDSEDDLLQIWDDFDGHVQLTPSQALQLLDYLQGQAESLRKLQEHVASYPDID